MATQKNSLEERAAIIRAKSEFLSSLPDPRNEDMTLGEFCENYWRFDQERFDNDHEYREEVTQAFNVKMLRDRSFNIILDEVYSVLE